MADDALHAGRAALACGAWREARAAFEQALAGGEDAAALEGLAWATWWLDDIAACFELRERAYRAYRSAGDACGAARVALAIGDDHLEFRGERAIASGWFRRARSLLEGCEPSAEHGWLLAFEGHAAILRHDTAEALRLGGEARELGRRLGVVSLEMFALASEGRALVTEGDLAEGMRRLDEAAAAALAGEYEDLLPAGWTCCYLIHACEAVCDYERAAQWCREVDSFSRRTHIGFVNGTCRASYGSVLVWHGRWAEAERELLAALESLTATRPFWRGEALVRLAQLRRRQGRPAEARALYDEAEWHSLARRGLVELALDAGDAAAAREGLEPILRALPAEAPTLRAGPIELAVRLAVLEGDVAAAEAHVEELGTIAAAVATPPLQGAASLCGGLVLAAAGETAGAQALLEDAVELYAASGAPFETGRARLELAAVLLRLGRVDSARRELGAALRRFEEIGAGGEVERARAALDALERAAAGRRASRAGGLTGREVEVLRLVAEGLSDRAIAARLVLSEHTVHRHVANIYGKLGCSTRAAAVAHASRLDLL